LIKMRCKVSSHSPVISVVVCTRNRGASAVETVISILANTHPSFELILIDQSTNAETEQALTQLCVNPHFRYVRSKTQGLGCARNIGLLLANGPLVAFTDDDCSVPANWLSVIGDAFALQPRAAVVFCNVEAAAYDPKAGYVPVYIRKDSKLVRTLWDQCYAGGIGAGMAVRRDVALDLGGFDEYLGAGGRFPSGEDLDIAVRALVRGHYVYETHQVAVTHYGFRSLEQLRALAKRDWIGLGAAYAKLIKCGHWSGLIVILYDSLVIGFLKPLSAIFRLRKPQGIRGILFFIVGFIEGLSTRVDCKHIAYKALNNVVPVGSPIEPEKMA
jgi:glycosyltransferase involved in cell wall biosynthesis